MQNYANGTALDPEEVCYPSGAMQRRGRALLRQNPHNPVSLPYGEVRAIRAGIPDTYFTVPAKLIHQGRPDLEGGCSWAGLRSGYGTAEGD
jgi:hypothetical protein